MSPGCEDATPGEILADLEFDRPMPRSVRDFGKIIDPSILEPGDLILVCKTHDPHWVSTQIQRYQSKLFAPDDARWHHAIVSGGGVEICEATSSGVIAREFWEYMTGDYELKIRRLTHVTEAERNRVAYYAATSVRLPYGYGRLLAYRAWFNSKDGGWSRGLSRSPGVVCSQLYADACFRVRTVVAANVPLDLVCPAHLAISDQMHDVPIEWVSVRG